MSLFKKSLYSALVFFGTLMVLSVGYAVLSSGLSNADKVGSGSGLTATSWNNIINGIFELDTRTANIFSSGGNVGIGTVNPGAKLDVVGNINVSGSIHSNNFSKNIASYSYTQAGTYTWSSIIQNAQNAGYMSNGVYDVTVRSSNGTWFTSWRATLAVSDSTSYSKVTNLYQTKISDGGCGADALSSVTTTGFTYVNNACHESIFITATKLD